MAVAATERSLRTRGAAVALRAERLPELGVVALAAALRLTLLGRTQLNPFYDAAVRSMGTSWHAFLVGAFDPSARLAIDKPPVDLWLQVASTKVLGFTPAALLLPAALGGTLAVWALYDLLRTLVGTGVAVAGALALAVLPVAVITSRSDTMDSVMAAALVGAFAVAARGLRDGRTSRIVLAGALVGLAFEIKLFEALVAVPPLALMWWLGARASRARRAAGLAAAAGACAAVGLAWLVAVTTLVPAHDRPWAFGSTNGSPWSSTFVYDGWDRVAGAKTPPVPPATERLPTATRADRARLAVARGRAVAQHRAAVRRAPAAPGPLRLLSAQAHLRWRLGAELVAAWLAVALALATGAWRRADRGGRAGLAAVAAWLALGTLLFSAQGGMRPRYLEAFDPALAACLGAGLVLGSRSLARRRAGLAAGALIAVALAAPAATSVAAVAHHTQDSGAPGALPHRRLDALSAYLRARQGGARYEVASVTVAKAGPLIAHDGRPVLLLTSAWGHPLVSTAQLARLVAEGSVRTALVGNRCTRTSADRWAACSAVAAWIRRHGADVSRQAGQPHPGLVYALGPPASRPRRR